MFITSGTLINKGIMRRKNYVDNENKTYDNLKVINMPYFH